MFDRLFSDRKEQKKKEQHEKELKERLAKKVANYDAEVESQNSSAGDSEDDTDASEHTEFVLNGKKLRVAKEQITIYDLDTDK